MVSKTQQRRDRLAAEVQEVIIGTMVLRTLFELEAHVGEAIANIFKAKSNPGKMLLWLALLESETETAKKALETLIVNVRKLQDHFQAEMNGETGSRTTPDN